MANEISINVKATDGASSVMGGIAKSGESMASKIGSSISSIGAKIGGELGEIVSKAGEVFEKFGATGASVFQKLSAGAGIVAGIGVALQGMASKDQAAQQQLQASVQATGGSWGDYEGRVEAAISAEEKYGHTASDTQNALNTLVLATGDTSSALDSMQVAADLAAAKHESLTTAASQLGKVADGNTKLLRQYGIDMTVTAGNTQQFNAAVTALGSRLAGQASAQASTFSGHVAEIKAEVEDAGSKFAAFAGGPLTYVGTGVSLLTGLMEIEAVRQATMTSKAAAATVALAAEGDAASIAGAEIAAGGAEAAAASSGFLSTLGPVGIGLGAVGLAAGVAAIAMNVFGGDSKKAAQPISDLTTALQTSAGAFNANTRSSIINQAQQRGLFDVSDKLKLSQAGLVDGLNGSSDAYTKNVAALQALIDAGTTYSGTRAGSYKVYSDTAKAAQDLLGKYQDLHGSVQASIQDAKDQAAAEAGAAQEATNLSNALKQFDSAADIFSNALKKITGDTLTTEGSLNSFRDNVDTVTSAVKTNGKSLDNNTTAGRKNEEAILSAIQAAQQHAEAVAQQTNSIDQANTALGGDESALLKAATAAGLNRDQVQALITKYGALPKDVATTISANADQALATLGSVQSKLSFIQGLASTDLNDFLRLSNYAAELGGSSAGHTAEEYGNVTKATGGIVAAATGGNRSGVIQWAEHGREMAKLPTGSYVMSNPDTERALASQGGAPTIEVHIHSDGSAMGRAMVEGLRYEVRVKAGGNVQKALGQG